MIVALGVLVVCFLGLSWLAGSDAPYVPTKKEKVPTALKLVRLKKGRVFYELGSGDGRLVFAAVRMGAQAFGIEQSWIRVLMCRYKAHKNRIRNARFIHGDIFKQNLSPADVVFIYLLPRGVKKLEEKLQKELKKGSLIITQKYHFPNWKPIKKEGDFWLYNV